MTIARKENLNSRLLPCSLLMIAGPIAILLSIAADESTIPHTSCDFDGDGCFNGFCYEFLPSASDFSNARLQCMEKLDYNLLSLHSEEESEFVARLLCAVNATSEVWTAGYSRTLALGALNTSFSWLVDDITLIIMDWMAHFETIDPNLNGQATTIVLSNQSGDSHYLTWVVVPPLKVHRHALCKRRMNGTNDTCLSSTVIFNDRVDNCTVDEKLTTVSSSTAFSSIITTLPTMGTKESSTTSTPASSTTNQSPYSFSSTSYSENSTTSPTPSPWSKRWSTATSISAVTTQSSLSSAHSTAATTRLSSDPSGFTNAFISTLSASESSSSSSQSSSSATTSQSTSGSTTSQSTSGITSQFIDTSTFTNHFLSGATNHFPARKSTTASTDASHTTWTSSEPLTTGTWCLATSFGGCDWPATPAGTTATTACPANSTGSATWYCDPETLVFEPEDTPNFSQCINDWVEAMEQEILLGHKSALEMAESLWSNTSVTTMFYSKDLSLLQKIMMEIDWKFLNETDAHVDANYTNQTRTYSEYLVYTCDVLLETNQSVAWDQLNEDRPQVADQLSINVEKVGFILASALDDQQDNIQRNNLALFVERRPKDVYADQGFQFKMSDGSSDQWQGITISLPNGFQENSLGNYTSVITILYSNMQSYLGDSYMDTSLAAEVITNVIGLSIGLGGQNVHFENDGIQFRIPHSISDDAHYHICSFWNSTRPPSGLWDSSGCTLVSQDSQATTCTCNHLTDFAILLDINGLIETMSPLAQEVLNLLTICCGSLSAVCLIICLVTFYSLRILRCIRISVTKNLCICLLIEDILVLTMMQETSNKVVCGLIAGTLEYVLLAAFVWMLIEGIHLYRLMILVFETCPRTLRWYYLIGYGVPFLIVAISASIYPQGFGTSLYCWLDDKLIWSFAVPVAIIILINFVMLILALRTASQVKMRRTQNKLVQFRKCVTGAISLTSVLGLTWVFGFFYVNQSTVIFAYIFTVLNASQGIFIFIFHCIVNETVRKCILRSLARCKECEILAKYKPDERRQLKTPQGAKKGQEKVDDGIAVLTLSNSVTLMTTMDSIQKQGKPNKPTISMSASSSNKHSFD